MILAYLHIFMSTGGDCIIGGTAGDPKSSADEGWVHLEELGDEYIRLLVTRKLQGFLCGLTGSRVGCFQSSDV